MMMASSNSLCEFSFSYNAQISLPLSLILPSDQASGLLEIPLLLLSEFERYRCKRYVIEKAEGERLCNHMTTSSPSLFTPH